MEWKYGRSFGTGNGCVRIREMITIKITMIKVRGIKSKNYIYNAL